MKKKRILVTGGAGFLGAHLCEMLINQGHYVIALDNFSTGSVENIAHLQENPLFQLIKHDVSVPYYTDVDAIYNLACPASPPHYQADPIHTIKTSVWGAMHLLELAKKTGAKIFQASTSEVYGDPLMHPQEESYWGNVNPIGIRSCYDEGKRCAETLCYEYHKQHNVDIRIGRIFNTYGPKMHPNDGRVVSNFIIQALKNEPITIYGDGTQTRSFCYVQDLLEAIVSFMHLPGAQDYPMNLGNPGEFTILELAEKIITMTNSTSEVLFCPLPSDDPRQRRPDISLARKKLGWQPKISLDEGLLATIQYFDEYLCQEDYKASV